MVVVALAHAGHIVALADAEVLPERPLEAVDRGLDRRTERDARVRVALAVASSCALLDHRGAPVRQHLDASRAHRLRDTRVADAAMNAG